MRHLCGKDRACALANWFVGVPVGHTSQEGVRFPVLVGPDLTNVSQRQERAWLVKFILDPAGVLDSGDPYATKLLEEAKKINDEICTKSGLMIGLGETKEEIIETINVGKREKAK